jgi:hypothetical protein
MIRIDMAVSARGKHNPSLRRRRVILIYKAHMHPEASLNPEQCTLKSDAKSRNNWFLAHIKSIDLYVDVYSREPHEGDTYMEEDTAHTTEDLLA